MLGFTALEAAIMELAWAAGTWLSAAEICQLLEPRRPVAQSTAKAALTALTRKGHLHQSGPDGIRRYHPAHPMTGHLASVIASLLEHSPDRTATLAQAGITGPGGSGPPRGVRIAICYDGWWYQAAARYFALQHGTPLALAGLHDAIRWHAAGLFGCPVQHVAISHAHYIAGRDAAASPRYDSELAGCGIIRHDMPVTQVKGEVGADVELALTCYHLALEARPDMIVLLAGDGDFAPLVIRLAARGTRVLIPVANFSYRGSDGATHTVRTSAQLTRRATDTPSLASLLAAADSEDYPRFLARPFPPGIRVPRTGPQPRRRGTISTWPPGWDYGFIVADDGLTWFAHVSDTPGRSPLPPGTPVTFTGNPRIPPGKASPPARAILHDQAAIGIPAMVASCPDPPQANSVQENGELS